MVTELSARRGVERSEWAIAQYEIFNDAGVSQGVRYAIYRDGERIVWGLTQQAVAARWIIRLGGRSPVALEPADYHATLEAADRAYGSQTPWWAA